jgi:hypothetical protein
LAHTRTRMKCVHNVIARQCKELVCVNDKSFISLMCIHETVVMRIHDCFVCSPKYRCSKTGIRKRLCTHCDGSSICEHKKLRSRCRDCKGSQICEHDKRRIRCTICDPTSAFVETSRSRCNAALKAGCIKKEKYTMDYLGCTPEEFRVHIASTFTEGMTMENHGTGVDRWAIDHRIALMYRDPLTNDKPSKEEIIKRLHYTNTQAMWSIENSRKGNR